MTGPPHPKGHPTWGALMGAGKTSARRCRDLLPRRADYAGLRRHWARDLLAGVTVAIVALPLALGFGVASGMGAAAGLVTAVVAGAVAAVFGGSNFQVSGPTGAMTVVLVPLIATHGPSSAVTVAVLAGAMVILMGLTGLGRLVTIIPWPVIEGFTVGIAVIIALGQIPLVLGVEVTPAANTAVTAVAALAQLGPDSVVPVSVTVLTMAIMIVVSRWRRTWPSSLIAVVAATGVAVGLGLAVATVGELPRTLPAPVLPDLNPAVIHGLLGSALAIALLAAIESLLSARVADGMTDSTPTNPDRELVGQGLANVASGMFGGMPATGAIARTAVNVKAGASTRVAALVHAVVLLVLVMLLAPIVAWVPLAALAGVLILTAYRMVELRTVRSLLQSTRGDRLVFGLTALCTIAFDLVVAVEIGIAVAAIVALVTLARTSATVAEPLPDLGDAVDTDWEHQLLHEHIAVYRIDGAMFFGAAQRFLNQLTSVADVRVVILRMSGIALIDATGAKMLRTAVEDLHDREIVVLFKGLSPAHEALLDSVGAVGPKGEHRHVFADLREAIEHGRKHVLSVGGSGDSGTGNG